MEKVRKLLSSPSSKRKVGNDAVARTTKEAVSMVGFRASSGGYFGVALEEICQRESREIPSLVTRTCSHIYNKGLHLEGLFRINGSSRVVENIRLGFDGSGDGDIEGAEDMMAVAGVLKLFLRELPQGLIPEALTPKFVVVQEDLGRQPQECLKQLQRLLGHLPTSHHHTLKYLMRFLVLVAKNENFNKMGAMALGIVFGPNVFRCSAGIQGLREQGVTNHIMLQFIREYDSLFLLDGEVSPYSNSFAPDLKKGRVAPPRPPPPRSDNPPVPSPRKSKFEREEPLTPRGSDEEFLDTQRTSSPINLLDTDRSEKGSVSFPLNSCNTEVLDKTITSVVAQRLFGESSSDDSNSLDGPHNTLVPAPRKKRKEKLDAMASSESEDADPCPVVSVKKRVESFEDDQRSEKAVRHRSKSDAYEVKRREEEVDEGKRRKPAPHPRSPRKRHASPDSPLDQEAQSHAQDSDDSGFGTIQRPQQTLNTFKRAPGPKNRRNPTRTSLKKSPVAMTIGSMETDFPDREEASSARDEEDVLGFLDLHSTLDESSKCGSEEKSCGTCSLKTAKPYVPPLDLSILHEHGNGSEPIRAHQSHSMSFHKAVSHQDAAMLSPHTAKMNRKSENTDIPPSPPTEQSLFLMSSKCEDEHSTLIKQLTKKIQSSKRKIKSFEEAFEAEHGYRPSQSDKATRPDIKKCIQELAKARKELRMNSYSLTPDPMTPDPMTSGPQDRFNFDESVTLSYGQNMAISFISKCLGVKEETDRLGVATSQASDPTDLGMPSSASQGQTLDTLMQRLKANRMDSGRPEDLASMTRDQVHEEKLCVQKALLHFEGVHGRPSTKSEKEKMRPLYDRYRTIKRLLNKPLSPKDKIELQAVPEDATIEFSPTSAERNNNADDFNVTRDLGLLKTTSKCNFASFDLSNLLQEQKNFREMEADDRENIDLSPEKSWNLHELTVPQLFEEQRDARNEKKSLRRILRDFEEQFLKETGRRVLKEERLPMEKEYTEYKQVKAKLKLVEALIAKHDSTIP